MNMTIQNHARKNWAVKEVFLALLGIFWGTQGVQIYDSKPIEMDEVDLWGMSNFLMNKGFLNLIGTIQHHSRENAAV